MQPANETDTLSVPTVRATDVPPGECLRVLLGGTPVAIFNIDGQLHAIDDTCSHQEASLSDGWVEGHLVECPLHSSCFDVRTGLPQGLPATQPVRVHAVSVADGIVSIRLALSKNGGMR